MSTHPVAIVRKLAQRPHMTAGQTGVFRLGSERVPDGAPSLEDAAYARLADALAPAEVSKAATAFLEAYPGAATTPRCGWPWPAPRMPSRHSPAASCGSPPAPSAAPATRATWRTSARPCGATRTPPAGSPTCTPRAATAWPSTPARRAMAALLGPAGQRHRLLHPVPQSGRQGRPGRRVLRPRGDPAGLRAAQGPVRFAQMGKLLSPRSPPGRQTQVGVYILESRA
jgi:hypothetical protein